MCRMCEGASREQVIDEARCHVVRHGWFLQGVTPEQGRDGGGWVYTVGLLENFGHPELVVTDVEYERGGLLLNELGEHVRSGLDLRSTPLNTVGLSALRQVHPDHFDNDLVNMYLDLQQRPPERGDYLQVVPASAYCECHRDRITDLSDPLQFPEGRRLNRAQRRAAERRRRGALYATVNYNADHEWSFRVESVPSRPDNPARRTSPSLGYQ